ncbi:MAG TPA: hypothetical protein VFJ57_06790 [Solirubrobacterales bacterium]|nr:hypothetical protein [Solirubrobacterales bacterium]
MPPKPTLLFLAVLTVLACTLPATTAAAGEIVPPGNSAVNQYTETFPTSEGEEQSSLEKKKGVTPNEVLGAGNTKKLDDKGAAGKAVAQFTAETAPTTSSDSGSGDESAGDGGNGKSNGDKGKGKQPNSGGNGQNGSPEKQESSANLGAGTAGSGGSGPSGSSGFGEIASQATGTASDSVGLWLPLLLIAVVAWSGFYVWRNRQQRVV